MSWDRWMTQLVSSSEGYLQAFVRNTGINLKNETVESGLLLLPPAGLAVEFEKLRLMMMEPETGFLRMGLAIKSEGNAWPCLAVLANVGSLGSWTLALARIRLINAAISGFIRDKKDLWEQEPGPSRFHRLPGYETIAMASFS